MATADWSISLRRRYGAGKVRNILFRKSFWFLTALAHSLHCCTLPTNTNNVPIITLHSCLICNDAFKGTGHATKSDEFSERFQTAVDPHPRHSLSLEIMCMHFILSGNHTSLHICIAYYATISIMKKLQHNFPKMKGGRRPFGILPKIHPIW